ncbi:MAG: MFS transporter permease [Jatrophihabitans sp.]
MTRPGWWFSPVPLGRIAVLRVLVYLYIPIDVLVTGTWVREHAKLGGELYHPLYVSHLLHLPTPTSLLVNLLEIGVVLCAVAAATGRMPRLTGSAAAVLYLAWMLVAMSYGKVDHDRFAFLVALAVLPTVGRARARDTEQSESAGWSLRCVQLAVVLTYFLASWAKIRYGGWHWPTGATLESALLRRSTPLSSWITDKPQLLIPMQFAMIGAELCSPLILLARSDRARTVVALGMWSFHLAVFAGVTIIFLPHCVAIFAFVPVERWWAWLRSRVGSARRGGARPDTLRALPAGETTAPARS